MSTRRAATPDCTAAAPAGRVRLALPVYGSRVMPRFGRARRFCIADIHGDPPCRLEQSRMCPWDPTLHAPVACWLRELGVSGVLCGGIHRRFQIALEEQALWVVWGQRGEAEEVLARWCRGEVQAPPGCACPGSAVEPCCARLP